MASSKGRACPPTRSAISLALSSVRLATRRERTPLAIRCRAVSSLISPAPMTRALWPSRFPKIFFASSTAA